MRFALGSGARAYALFSNMCYKFTIIAFAWQVFWCVSLSIDFSKSLSYESHKFFYFFAGNFMRDAFFSSLMWSGWRNCIFQSQTQTQAQTNRKRKMQSFSKSMNKMYKLFCYFVRERSEHTYCNFVRQTVRSNTHTHTHTRKICVDINAIKCKHTAKAVHALA